MRDYWSKTRWNYGIKIPKEAYAIHLWNEKWRREIKNKSIGGYIKKFVYKISAELKKHSKIYSRFICLAKKEPYPEIVNLPDTKKRSTTIKFDKNKIYSTKTLYGKLQRKYL